MAIKMVTSYEGEIDPATDIEYTFTTESESKMVDDNGDLVAVDGKGIALVDTHKFKSFPKQVLKAKLKIEGSDPIEITQDVDELALKLAKSPETTLAKLATQFAVKVGCQVKGEK